MSSYLQYFELPSGLSVPVRFEFNKLQGSVFGTHVKVSCQNVISGYAIIHGDFEIATEIDAAIVNITLVE